MKPAERLKRSRGGHKGWNTRLKGPLKLAKKPRYARLSPQGHEKMLRHWIANALIPWTQNLFESLKKDAARHGINV